MIPYRGWRGGQAPFDPHPGGRGKEHHGRRGARIGSNLNQIARWANTHKENAEAVEVIAHLVSIERALGTLAVRGEPRGYWCDAWTRPITEHGGQQ